MNLKSAVERTKNHLAYKLGQEMLESNKRARIKNSLSYRLGEELINAY